MLAVSWDTVRLFLHVLAATVWVGGQLTLAALVPVLRRLGAGIPGAAARRFNQVAWPAFAILILTGIWNVIAVRSQITGSYETTLIVKLASWPSPGSQRRCTPAPAAPLGWRHSAR